MKAKIVLLLSTSVIFSFSISCKSNFGTVGKLVNDKQQFPEFPCSISGDYTYIFILYVGTCYRVTP